MKTKTISYNVVLPVTGTVDVPDNATDEYIENAIYDDARDAATYKSAWKSMDIVDIYDVTNEVAEL